MVRRHISSDLKEMALSMSLQGLRDSEVREYTGISERSLKRLRSTFRKTGGVLPPLPVNPGRPQILTAIQAKFLCDCVARQPDIALVELQAELREGFDVVASVTTIARSLQRRGYSMKTVARPAFERNEKDRQEFMAQVAADFRPDQLVFADESHFNRLTLKRPYAWSIRGERGRRYEFSLRGTKYSILPALSLDGILHLEVLEDAITGEDFGQLVRGLLPRMNKWPLPNSVLVIDNTAIHKIEGIREMVEEHGSRILYLPTYSPDFNPIDYAFSSIRSWLRSNRDRVNLELESEGSTVHDIFSEAIHSITAEDLKGWYKDCGYRAMNPNSPVGTRGETESGSSGS